MSAVSRKPLDRFNMHLGGIISDMCHLGAISMRVFERSLKNGKMRQIIMHVRVRVEPEKHVDALNEIYLKTIATVPLISYVLYKEKDYWYADYQFIL